MAAAVALVAGCGGTDDYANKKRPPAPINVTANITDQRVAVSPRSFGAGPIVLIIANLTDKSQRVTFETSGGPGSGPGIRQTTSPVNPSGTAELKVDVKRGTYELSVGSEAVRPGLVRVGAPRESAQNQLLQP